jgi:hypothetical protein
MARAVSIHIGVDHPHGDHVPLRSSESNAWRMAGLANQAGYPSLLVLRGHAATRQAVHEALTRAAGALASGDNLLVTFSGHGIQQPDCDDDLDERCGRDQGWCMADGVLLDDKLAGYWRLFEPGVRIVVVSESCYSGGMGRDDDEDAQTAVLHPPPRTVYRRQSGYRGGWRSVAGADYAGSCIGEPPRDTDGIRASLLMLTASTQDQTAEEGLFARHLLGVWDDGAFHGSYCDLHRAVRERVMRERCTQDPQILMLGSGDPGFPLSPAFRLDPYAVRRTGGYR